jgi:chromosome segregation protein
VFVKRLELTNFKSFGGTTEVPILPGFTVISGPNGSGKSNLLDALLFCLGLAGSKGMRAERLPDLVNQAQAGRGRTVEASVTVTFDLSDDLELLQETDLDGTVTQEIILENNEWNVTRKLRVTQQGTYTSNYYINGESCTLTDLHEQLNRLRVYPEGYNVVLQGDVTRIISMNPRERREIIDELAGVASFDRKIVQAREKLDAVKDREDKYRIVERELIDQRDRLSQDRAKAEKYKKLRAEMQLKEQWEAVFKFQQSQKQTAKLTAQITKSETEIKTLTQQIETAEVEIRKTGAELDELNARVRALGEAEQIALQSQLATREAEYRQLDRATQDLNNTSTETQAALVRIQAEIAENTARLNSAIAAQAQLETQELKPAQDTRAAAQAKLEISRTEASQSAASAEAWVQEQTALRHHIDTILAILEPQRTEQAKLLERSAQLEKQLEEQTRSHTALSAQLQERTREQQTLITELASATQTVQGLAQEIAAIDQELQIQRETQVRLQNEQKEKQRKLDKLEAQKHAIQEAQGTFATQVILGLEMSGVHGLVAQLGQVNSKYQLALEVAAGARLGHLVVDDDAIAAAAIEILKKQRAGRATFLPLNKIRAPQIPDAAKLKTLNGCVGYAIDLVDCDDKYWDVFAYVFGGTVVFESIDRARQNMGKFRMVTLDGELLESSGAMTGGSIGKSTLHFGSGHARESSEVIELRERLSQIDTILFRCEDAIAKGTIAHQNKTKQLIEARQKHRDFEMTGKQLTQDIERLTGQTQLLMSQINQQQTEAERAGSRLQVLSTEVPQQETQVASLRASLEQLEQSQNHSEWQGIQAGIRELEAELQTRDQALRSIEQQLIDYSNQKLRAEERIAQGTLRLQELRDQQTTALQQAATIDAQKLDINTALVGLRAALVELDKTLGEERGKRDALDRTLRELQTARQQADWQIGKTHEALLAQRQELETVREQLLEQEQELPNPPPEIPEDADRDLPALQHEIRSLQRRLQSMEPVNMMALEEYDRTQERLQELTDKLSTLEEERTELLLRIENFTTLRVRAFREAYDVVDENFQEIFATLSDGDGRLQLEDQQDPFNGGLNLIAHPKGKQVLRLASMSGGEKSLTALSFIFALQRYRPSPFYAFDEVDMFLDGANVEKLARMIKHQATLAQFIVVSLRRPMIESAQRTIGVTQARGAHTQVLGIQLEMNTPAAASS